MLPIGLMTNSASEVWNIFHIQLESHNVNTNFVAAPYKSWLSGLTRDSTLNWAAGYWHIYLKVLSLVPECSPLFHDIRDNARIFHFIQAQAEAPILCARSWLVSLEALMWHHS